MRRVLVEQDVQVDRPARGRAAIAVALEQIQAEIECMEQPNHETELGPRPAPLECADPLPGHTHASCQLDLTQAKSQSTGSDRGYEIAYRVDLHA
jgi:hypothetical protein